MSTDKRNFSRFRSGSAPSLYPVNRQSDFPYQDRYRELLRAGRQWRHLKELASFGFANNDRHPGEGELALFCAACLQPGVNLPDGWEGEPNQYKSHGHFFEIKF